MTLEEQLKELMKKKSGSVNKFAKEIDMPQGTLAGILDRGFLNASLRSAVKICDGLGISLNDVVRGYLVSTEELPPDKRVQWFRLDEEKQKSKEADRLTRYIDALAETLEKMNHSQASRHDL